MGDFDEWKAGGRAFLAGSPIWDNPYEYDTADYIDWRDGWIQAQEGRDQHDFNENT